MAAECIGELGWIYGDDLLESMVKVLDVDHPDHHFGKHSMAITANIETRDLFVIEVLL